MDRLNGGRRDGSRDPSIRSSELQLEMVLSPLGVISLRSSSDSITATLEIMAQSDIHYLFVHPASSPLPGPSPSPSR
jgi:hypothetical protein